MSIVWMNVILLLLSGVQSFMPYLVKRTEVFGIYVPEQYTQQPLLKKMKRKYCMQVLALGLLAAAIYTVAANLLEATEGEAVVWGVGVQLGVIAFSMGLYFVNHLKVKKEKQQQGWTIGKKEKVIVDLQFRNDLEMISGMAFLLPMVITAGLLLFTLSVYEQLPEQIPVHWGPDGIADRFSDKTIFSSISMLLLLLIMQGLFYAMNHARKTSGSKIRATQKIQSRERELASRKYGSWLLFITSLSVTLLMGSLQISIIYPELASSLWVMAITSGFLILILGATVLYTFKVAKSSSGTQMEVGDVNIIDADSDKYWRAGIFYVNKEDPSIMVEKRFGIGWTINFGNPVSWLLVLAPFSIILLITFLL